MASLEDTPCLFCLERMGAFTPLTMRHEHYSIYAPAGATHGGKCTFMYLLHTQQLGMLIQYMVLLHKHGELDKVLD